MEDVGLSLSLFSGAAAGAGDRFPPPLQLTLMPPSTSSARVVRAGKESGESSEESESEDGGWSPVSTLARAGGKRGLDAEAEAEAEAEESRKKLRLSKDQTAVLEERFKQHSTLNPKQKVALAKQLNLRPRQVEVWFQNRRARTKLKQTEVDCEYLKRWCEKLAEENGRLQKEVGELRALKLRMNVPPPTTLTMCPSCERVAPSSSSAAAAAATTLSSLPPPSHPMPDYHSNYQLHRVLSPNLWTTFSHHAL